MDRKNALAALTELIHARRSVRAYSHDVIDRPTLNALLCAAVQAPTAMYSEPWRFVVVKAPTVLRRISDRAKDLLMHDAQRHHAPLAAQNLMLTAQSMGLGACVIGSAVAALNLPQTQQELGIPLDIYAVAPIIAGKPRELAVPSPRQAPHVLAWLEAAA